MFVKTRITNVNIGTYLLNKVQECVLLLYRVLFQYQKEMKAFVGRSEIAIYEDDVRVNVQMLQTSKFFNSNYVGYFVFEPCPI